MLKTIYTIAINSFREFLRDRIVFVCVFVAIFLFGTSFLLGALSFAEQIRILAHMGFLAIYLSGVGVVVFLGGTVLSKEVEKQTCLLVLARPITRAQFLLGKYFGVWILNTFIWIVLSTIHFVLLKSEFSIQNYLSIILGIYLEQLILLSIAFCGSIFLTSTTAIFCTIAVFLTGNWIEDFTFFAKKVKDPLFLFVSKLVQLIFPNLFQLNWRSIYFLEKGISGMQIQWGLIHTTGWVVLLISLAILKFRSKDLV